MATKKSSCTSITDLNEDCMRRVFFYLRLIDRLKFGLACNRFDEIFATCLRKDVFIMRECIQAFTLDEVKQILERFGPYIRRLSLRQTIDNRNIDFYKLIPHYCHSIETIELQRNLKPTHEELDVYKDILWATKGLRSVQVFQNRKLDRELRDREIVFYHLWGCALCLMISNLTTLETLHYSDSSLLGSDLCKLKNLTELNIAYCSNFNSSNFVEICRAVKLHTLNINNCTKLDNAALDALVETQTELQHLTISNNLLAHNYEVIGRLESLSQLILFDKNSKKLCELMYELSNCHRDDLDTLKISSNCILFDSKFRQHLLSFRNLKVYYPSNVVLPDDDYLVEIGTKFPNLLKLKICVSAVNTCEGFVSMLRLLKNLTELILDYSSDESYKFDLDFLRKIIEVRRSMNSGLLTLHLLQGTVAHDVFRVSMSCLGSNCLNLPFNYLTLVRFLFSFQSREYRSNLDIVNLRRHKPQYIHRI